MNNEFVIFKHRFIIWPSRPAVDFDGALNGLKGVWDRENLLQDVEVARPQRLLHQNDSHEELLTAHLVTRVHNSTAGDQASLSMYTSYHLST